DRRAGQAAGDLRRDQPVLERLVDDRLLDELDRYRLLVDPEHAGGLARRRAQPPGELRAVVGRVQPFDRVTPPPQAGEVVPLGDEVPERAAVVAERDAAVHATAGLPCQRRAVLGTLLVHLAPVLEPDRHRTASGQLTLPPLEEALRVSHGSPPGRGSRRWAR